MEVTSADALIYSILQQTVFYTVQFVVLLFKTWWWILPPIILYPFFLRAWLLWRRELWESKQKFATLEIIPPKEVLKPFSSMEHIFSNIWSIHSSVEGIKNFRKKWIDGRKQNYLSVEIVSIGQYPHFFIHLNKKNVSSVKAALYSQYPDIEFRDVEEAYEKGVSLNIPGKRWDMYGFDITLVRSDIYPIKTYSQFFETSPESTKEEKRIDPLSTLLEGLGELKEGEQIWLQMRFQPVASANSDYIKRGETLINKLAHRDEKGKKADGKEGFIPPEMKMTPREREVLNLIEDKVGKYVFQTNIRCLYFGRTDIYESGRRSLAEQYFASFSAPDLNIMKKFGRTKTRILHFFVKRRLYSRKKRILRRYLLRETPLYPKKGGTFIFSTEECATVFHMPIGLGEIGSMLQRVESRKEERPFNLPV